LNAFAGELKLGLKIHRILVPIFVGLVVGSALFGASLPRDEDWRISGPYGGSATAVAVDSHNPKVLLAGARQSLLYKSDDSGNSWMMLPFPKRSFGEVGAILIDPVDSQHYIVGLVGTGNAGLFESIDAGVTWRPIPALTGLSVRALAVSASDPSRFVAGTTQGVYLSADSGQSWTRISDPGNLEMLGITAVAIDPADPATIYAGTPHLPWKTTDGGKTWQSIHSGMIDDSDVFSIYVNPLVPGQVFASACSGIYRSANGGGIWRKMMGIPNTHRRTHVIRMDPEQPGTIYAGTTLGLFKSIDRGVTWQQVNNQQVNSLAFDAAQPFDMYLALEDDGLWKADNHGGALSPLNNGFVARRLTAVTVSGKRLVAIQTQDGNSTGIFVSEDGGESWSKIPRPSGLEGIHLSAITGVPGDDKLLFAANPRQVFKSADGGQSWKAVDIAAVLSEKGRYVVTKGAKGREVVKQTTVTRTVHPNEIHSLAAIGSGTQPVLFAATNRGLLRSSDKGSHWDVSATGSADNFGQIYTSPISDGRLVARSSIGIYFSDDFGQNWKATAFPFPTSELTDFAVPPVGTHLPMLAATVHGLYLSRDLGRTWYSVTSGLPVSTVKSVVYSSTQGFVAYAVLYGQLFQSKDGGDTWSAVPSSFRSLSIRQLWQPAELPDRLFAVTNDIGILFRNQALIR
jgi:photosystem II stability/assembly factor-like uncharacterized protein